MELEDFREKTKKTNMVKYGVENVMQNEKIRHRATITVRERYGVDNPSQHPEFKEKRTATILERYGVENAMQHPQIAELSRTRANESLKANGTMSCSSQQRYIHEELGGELNYLFDRIWLDIAFLEDKIYLEYDGSGHNIDVLYCRMTQEEFDRKEMKRYFFLKSKGWKQIRIISTQDLIPCQQVLDNLISYSKEVLKTNNWIEFNLDNSQILTKNEIIHYDFKAIRINKIKQKHK